MPSSRSRNTGLALGLVTGDPMIPSRGLAPLRFSLSLVSWLSLSLTVPVCLEKLFFPEPDKPFLLLLSLVGVLPVFSGVLVLDIVKFILLRNSESDILLCFITE